MQFGHANPADHSVGQRVPPAVHTKGTGGGPRVPVHGPSPAPRARRGKAGPGKAGLGGAWRGLARQGRGGSGRPSFFVRGIRCASYVMRARTGATTRAPARRSELTATVDTGSWSVMARRKGSRRSRPRSRSRAASGTPKLDKAKRIVRAMTSGGAQRSTTVRAAVARAGISTRTYRTARKQLRTKAIRLSRRRRSRGSGAWYAKT